VVAHSDLSSAASGEPPSSLPLPDGTSLRLVRRAAVYANPDRDLHGPCAVRTRHGDLLLCHQDSLAHHGGDGFVHQWRSRDQGQTWVDEGPAADWRDREYDALFGEYGLAPNGRLVMVVQRRRPEGGNDAIVSSVWYTSDDEGHTWDYRGEVDTSHPDAVITGREVVTCGSTLLFGAWSRLGSALYASADHGASWQRRSVVFPVEHPDFGGLAQSGPPYYPHVMPAADGGLVAVTYITPPANCCYFRYSADEGHTWGPVQRRDDIEVWAPRLGRLGDLLIMTGRDIGRRATVLRASADGGHTWNGPHVVDQPAHEGSYAYTDSLALSAHDLWVFTSSPQSPGRGDILGYRFSRS